MLGTGNGMLNKTDKLSILSWNLHSRQVANIDQMYHYKFDGYYKGEKETSITTLFVRHSTMHSTRHSTMP